MIGDRFTVRFHMLYCYTDGIETNRFDNCFVLLCIVLSSLEFSRPEDAGIFPLLLLKIRLID